MAPHCAEGDNDFTISTAYHFNSFSKCYWDPIRVQNILGYTNHNLDKQAFVLEDGDMEEIFEPVVAVNTTIMHGLYQA